MNRKPWVLAATLSAVGVGALVGGHDALRASEQPASSTSETRVATSVLEAIPGFRFVESHLDEAQFDREEAARQNLIKACMAARGFTYYPTASQRVDSPSARPADAGPDPNVTWAASLDEKTRAAHYRALYGTDDPFDPTARATPQGCATQAHARIPGVFALSSRWRAELEGLRRAAAKDPRVVAADARWSRCMADHGVVASSREDLLQRLDAAAVSAGAALATDRAQCAADLDSVRNTVRIEYENAFAAKHTPELRAHQQRLAVDEALVTANQNSQ